MSYLGDKVAKGILTKSELRKIETEVDEINSKVELLDPSNPLESEQLYFYDLQLSRHLEVLEASYKKSRIKEIGLKVVS